jgi:uncharacterized membrane protein
MPQTKSARRLLKLHETNTRFSSWSGGALFALAVGLYIATRLWHLTAFSLDGDEIFSVLAARMRWAELVSYIIRDVVHPPLFYLLLKVWIGIGGESLLWLRLFPALTAIAAIVPFFLLCRELNLRDMEMNLALVLMGVNEYLIFYANHLRMYSLLLLLSLCSLWLFARYFNEENGSQKILLALFAVNLLLVYTHYYGLLIVGLEALSLLLWKRSKLIPFAIYGVVLALCFSPWMYAVARASKEKKGLGQNLDWITRPNMANLTWFYGTLNGLFDFRRSTSLGLLLFIFPVLLWGWHLWQGERSASRETATTFWWLLCFSFLPVAVAFSASQLLAQSVWGERHLIIVAVPYMILVAVGVYRLRPLWVRTLALILVVAWAAVAGFKAQAAADKKIAWNVLVASMSQAEPTRAAGLKVYAFEDFVATPLRYHLERAQERRFQVALISDMDAVEGDHFWVAFRDATWKQARHPQEILIEKGYQVGQGFESKMSDEQVELFPVWRR